MRLRPCLILLLFLPALARASIEATPLFPPATAPTFLLLKITASPATAPLAVTLQDHRGGPRITRTLDNGITYLPCPYLAPTDLPPNAWPLDLTLTSDGRPLESRLQSVPRSPGASPTTRLLVADSLQQTALPAQFTGPKAATAPLPDAELLAAPPALFAAADILVLSPSLLSAMDHPRLSAILATGIQLLVQSPAPPTSIPNLTWTRIEDLATQPPFWISPRLPVSPIAVIEPGLPQAAAALAVTNRPLSPAGNAIVWSLLPATTIALLLARILFHRRFSVLIAFALGSLAITALALFLLSTAEAVHQITAAWQTSAGSLSQPTPRVTLEESLTISAPRFGGTTTLSGPANTLLLPLAASSRDFFTLTPLTWSLDDNRLTASLRPNTPLHTLSRTVSLGSPIPALSQTPAILIDAGYAAPFPTTAPATRTAFPAWARSQPTRHPAAAAWYALRFQASRRYLASSTDAGTLTLFDLGTAP